ncbi:MAG: acyltransferase [Candidatus Elarobacter sp.]
MDLVRDGRIATIDGLRGIAIAIVLWLHYWQISWQGAVIPFFNISLQPIAETGYFGVALFFFISGFVLLLPYAQAHVAGTPAPTWRQFYTRRVLKIVPSYVLCIAVLIAIGYQTYASVPFAVQDVAFHLLFVHDWFASTSGSIDGVMWSLGVEIQFYLIFPLLVAGFVRRPLLATLAMFAVANGWRIWTMLSNHYFYELRLEQLPGFIDFFAAGMACAWLYVAIAIRHPQLAARRWLFSALTVAGFVAFYALLNNCYERRGDHEWPQLWEVQFRSVMALSVIPMALGSLFALRGLQRVLANPLLLFLAAISYNLYLWHQPIARMLVKAHVPPYSTADPHDDRVWMLAFWGVSVPLALVVAAALTFWFEQPILRLGKRLSAPRAAVPIASETIAVTAEM